jgi:hypothetical protein
MIGLTLLLGFNQNDKDKGLGGFMMYWHGVLIQAYHRYVEYDIHLYILLFHLALKNTTSVT